MAGNAAFRVGVRGTTRPAFSAVSAGRQPAELTGTAGFAACATVLAVDREIAAALRTTDQAVATTFARAFLSSIAGGSTFSSATNEACTAFVVIDAMLAIVIFAAHAAGTAGRVILAARRTLVLSTAILAGWALVVARRAIHARAVVQAEATGAAGTR